MKVKKISTSELRALINGRLGIKTIQRELMFDFDLKPREINQEFLTSMDFSNRYDTWEQQKQNKFCRVLGGQFYANQVKTLMNFWNEKSSIVYDNMR